jgi:hypothetical protein
MHFNIIAITTMATLAVAAPATLQGGAINLRLALFFPKPEGRLFCLQQKLVNKSPKLVIKLLEYRVYNLLLIENKLLVILFYFLSFILFYIINYRIS